MKSNYTATVKSTSHPEVYDFVLRDGDATVLKLGMSRGAACFLRDATDVYNAAQQANPGKGTQTS